MRITTDLQGIKDPIPFLQIFSHKVCTGVLAANHKQIHKISVDQYIRSVGQIFAAVGPPQNQDSTQWAQSIFAWDNSFQPTQKKIPPPEECAHSLYPSSTVWNQLPKASRLEEEQLQTFPGSLSSSSSDPVNTARVEQIQSPPPSTFATSSSLW